MHNLTRRGLWNAFTAPADASTLDHSRAFPFDQMPVAHMANGGESRAVLHGTLATGEVLSLHESIQPAGIAPNPAHTIQHSEFIFILDGTVSFQHDGRSEQAGPGSVLFVAPGTLHALRNIGDGSARYIVLAVGGDVHP